MKKISLGFFVLLGGGVLVFWFGGFFQKNPVLHYCGHHIDKDRPLPIRQIRDEV